MIGIKMFFSLIVMALGSVSWADDYQFTVIAEDPGEAILLKNCLDYNKCGGSGMRLEGTVNSKMVTTLQTSTLIRLSSDLEAASSLQTCMLDVWGVTANVSNLTTGKAVQVFASSSEMSADVKYQTLNQKWPNIYMPVLSEEAKVSRLEGVKFFLKEKDALGAVEYAMNAYGFTSGIFNMKIEVRPEGDLGMVGGIETDAHVTILGKDMTINFSPTILDENKSCSFVLALRHELEHALQHTKVLECKKFALGHNFAQSYQRERAAWFNDYRNIDRYCPAGAESEKLKKSVWNGYVSYYL